MPKKGAKATKTIMRSVQMEAISNQSRNLILQRWEVWGEGSDELPLRARERQVLLDDWDGGRVPQPVPTGFQCKPDEVSCCSHCSFVPRRCSMSKQRSSGGKTARDGREHWEHPWIYAFCL